jgi:hypothetical protein
MSTLAQIAGATYLMFPIMLGDFLGQANYEFFQISVNPGIAPFVWMLLCPFASHQFTMPLEKSL